MPRPIRPKSFESEGPNHTRSTTPRAYSPTPSGGDRLAPQGILRRDFLSNNTRGLPRTDSPVFLGSSTREKLDRSFSRSYSPVVSYDSTRAASPLHPSDSQSFQHPSSSDLYDEQNSRTSNDSHSQDTSIGVSHVYSGFAHERSHSGAQSLSIPARPDAPLLSSSQPELGSNFALDSSKKPDMNSIESNNTRSNHVIEGDAGVSPSLSPYVRSSEISPAMNAHTRLPPLQSQPIIATISGASASGLDVPFQSVQATVPSSPGQTSASSNTLLSEQGEEDSHAIGQSHGSSVSVTTSTTSTLQPQGQGGLDIGSQHIIKENQSPYVNPGNIDLY
jgi:hypothetical protein